MHSIMVELYQIPRYRAFKQFTIIITSTSFYIKLIEWTTSINTCCETQVHVNDVNVGGLKSTSLSARELNLSKITDLLSRSLCREGFSILAFTLPTIVNQDQPECSDI